jgi:hypothetical protein
MTQRHRKLFSAGERLGAKLFADWYRFGNGKRPAGIVHYVGGAITEDKYRRRRGTRPDAIATHFRAALARTRLRCVDLLVSSAPPYPPGPREDILRDFRDHVVVDLLQQVPAPRPHPVAFVGNSTGAFLATYLAFSVPGSRSLATIAGVGMEPAAQAGFRPGRGAGEVRIFTNLRDEAAEYNDALSAFLAVHGVPFAVFRRRGDHDFHDYVENGSLLEAFRFALESLAGR